MSEPAFPTEHKIQHEDEYGHKSWIEYRWLGGLTKREYFAAQAMQALITSEHETPNGTAYGPSIAGAAVQFADALIAELAKAAA